MLGSRNAERRDSLIHLIATGYRSHPKRGISLEMSGSQVEVSGNLRHANRRHSRWVLGKGVSAQWLPIRFGSSSAVSTGTTRFCISSTDECRCSAPRADTRRRGGICARAKSRRRLLNSSLRGWCGCRSSASGESHEPGFVETRTSEPKKARPVPGLFLVRAKDNSRRGRPGPLSRHRGAYRTGCR
jgi:hypothetical protein